MVTFSRRQSSRLSFDFLRIFSLLAIVGLVGSGLSAQVKRPSKAGKPGDISVIQHIVFIIKENRSFDNYFGQYPGANGATSGTTSTGQVRPLRNSGDQVVDIDHEWVAALTAVDNGKMDRFDLIPSLARPIFPTTLPTRKTSCLPTTCSPPCTGTVSRITSISSRLRRAG